MDVRSVHAASLLSHETLEGTGFQLELFYVGVERELGAADIDVGLAAAGLVRPGVLDNPFAEIQALLRFLHNRFFLLCLYLLEQPFIGVEVAGVDGPGILLQDRSLLI